MTRAKQSDAVEPDPQVQEGYEAAQHPERQGDGDPAPRAVPAQDEETAATPSPDGEEAGAAESAGTR